jgi:hypothetical protein
MRRRRRAIGVDFSGARDAGRAIWIAEGAIRRDGLELADCRPAAELPNGARLRAAALAALVAYLGAQTDAVIGCDFPVGLPKELVEEADWPAFLVEFAKRHASAEAFRADCRKRSPRELRRPTDIAAKTPFCAWNLRLYRQTYHGIADLLAPLVAAGRATVGPMQPTAEGRAWILETCPASVLKRLGLYRSYKGRSAGAARNRRAIIDALVAHGALVRPEPRLRSRLVEDRGGDALDAVIACLAAVAAARRKHPPASADEMLGGKVYFEI